LSRYLRLVSWCAAALLALAGWACSSKKKGELAPLTASAWRIELPVEGFRPASLAVPLGAKQPRPIVVVLHGAGDRADWQCGSFRGVLGGKAFILCPQGLARADGLFDLGSVDQTAAELRAGLKALKRRFGQHVAPSPILLIGWAAGADQAAELMRQEPSFFARVALVAGKPSAVSSSTATIFGKRGGKRVLFFCATEACRSDAVMRALLVRRAGAQAQVVHRPVGPFLDAAFTAALRPEFSWLLEGDKRFAR
jgi:poly(3-hydroxybutyrate) depolymerase